MNKNQEDMKLKETHKLGMQEFLSPKFISRKAFDFNRFRLAALEPFAAPIAENLRGLASGELTVKGSASNPEIKGAFELPKAGLTVSFLQTDYNLVGNPKLLLDNQSIRFPNLELMDQYNTISYLTKVNKLIF